MHHICPEVWCVHDWSQPHPVGSLKGELDKELNVTVHPMQEIRAEIVTLHGDLTLALTFITPHPHLHSLLVCPFHYNYKNLCYLSSNLLYSTPYLIVLKKIYLISLDEVIKLTNSRIIFLYLNTSVKCHSWKISKFWPIFSVGQKIPPKIFTKFWLVKIPANS